MLLHLVFLLAYPQVLPIQHFRVQLILFLYLLQISLLTHLIYISKMQIYSTTKQMIFQNSIYLLFQQQLFLVCHNQLIVFLKVLYNLDIPLIQYQVFQLLLIIYYKVPHFYQISILTYLIQFYILDNQHLIYQQPFLDM